MCVSSRTTTSDTPLQMFPSMWCSPYVATCYQFSRAPRGGSHCSSTFPVFLIVLCRRKSLRGVCAEQETSDARRKFFRSVPFRRPWQQGDKDLLLVPYHPATLTGVFASCKTLETYRQEQEMCRNVPFYSPEHEGTLWLAPYHCTHFGRHLRPTRSVPSGARNLP